MTPARQRLLDLLRRYLPPAIAEGTLVRSVVEAGLKAETLSMDELPALIPSLDRRIRLLLDDARYGRVSAELAVMRAERPQRKGRSVVVRIESDISEARRVAREVCEEAAARGFILHKVVTIVSELARNIVRYTKGGSIEVGLVRDRPARIAVVSADSGPGIRNLEEILAGHYRSRTGMGRGILGVKQLADRFRINPGPPGTRVEVEVHL